MTGQVTLVGTPLYMSPEGLLRKRIDQRSDIYALGAVAYFLLCGKPVFTGANLVEIGAHHLYRVPEPPSRRTERPIPEALEALVMRCLEKDPDKRPASGRELGSLLAECASVGAWSDTDARVWWTSSETRIAEGRAHKPELGPASAAFRATVAVARS